MSAAANVLDLMAATSSITVAAHPPKNDVGVDDDVPGFSDDDLAARFTDRHRHDLRHVAAWGVWLIWTGAHWQRDDRLRVFDLSRQVCRDVLTEAREAGLTHNQLQRLRNRLGSAQTIYSVVRLAGSDPAHAVSVDQLDADPWALNTPGGVVDLRTGAMHPHDPARLHTKITAGTPRGECPLFMQFLERVQPDPSLRDYLQRLAGYALTGSAREHVLPFGYGTGRNGKGTLFHTLRAVLGDYAVEIAAETLMETHHDRHPTELAVFRGVRLVIGSEVDAGRRWNESRVKRLTGGDPISARYIGQDLFEFDPSHTLVIVGNNKPALRSVDEAIRARIHLIPFAVAIPEAERDTTLPERLRAEFDGILAWALAGCLDWQADGLRAPPAIVAATSAYLDGEDAIANWLADCTVKGGQVTLKAAHSSYRKWCEANSVPALGRNTFADQLRDRNLAVNRSSANATVIVGIELSGQSEGSEWSR
ncbi:MAG: putative primase/helicase [Pseudomonadota bacterium]|nr:putative primase/helicase [Pseudomonadota bacterium]